MDSALEMVDFSGGLLAAEMCKSAMDTSGRKNSLNPSHSKWLPIRDSSLSV